MRTVRRLSSKLMHHARVAGEGWGCRLRRNQPARILFSKKPDWEDAIARGFRRTRHRITFDELTSQNVGECDLVIPLTIADLTLADTLRDALDDRVVPIPRTQVVELCDDKPRLNETLVQSGFAAQIPRMDVSLPFPYVVKRRISEWGKDCFVVRNRDDQQAVVHLLDDPQFFTQECVGGHAEFAAHILFRKNAVAECLTIRYDFDVVLPVKGVDAPADKRVCRSEHLPLFTAMLHAIGFEGLCCLNYKIDNGQVRLIEINPRCGGSLCPYLFAFIDRALASAR